MTFFFAFFPLHRAQRRRLDQRSLVNSEFQSGFEGINVGQLFLAVHGNRCGKIITMLFFFSAAGRERQGGFCAEEDDL